ncbi:SycD/LcrH family type III secretion system chaperone [Parachitinimonas caeni]|uniref:SycD/LcrH family type III secretion system chaperone n=1 Tax=Parachitinimonas caeni TaxID=3031301 RepID=A0ABT7DTY1_9NEIS|nr:SycD/LcrH family type III secretion system chaperone [Parachitinimonas caeni]MDK2123491.1 SycD/LcrH family type III secretion system chaperone [Parachitinimonas caeni]
MSTETVTPTNSIDAVFEEFAKEAAQLPGARRFHDEDLEMVYMIGYNLYMQTKYTEALRYFALLTTYRPLETRYLMGLGATQQMLKNYEGAIQAYALATMVKPEESEPTLHVAECLVGMGQFGEARETLRMLIHVCNLSGKVELRGRAEGLLTLIEKH